MELSTNNRVVIALPLTIIITSFFLFPFYFTFLPSVNTKMILAAGGLIMFGIKLGIKQMAVLDKDFLLISLCAAGVSLASYLSMTLNNTNDNSYLSYLVSMWVWLGAGYFVVNWIQAIHGRVTVELFAIYLICVGVCQCLIAVAIDSVPAIRSFVDGFLDGEGYMGKVKNRLYGIGCALDVAGGRFAALLIMIAALLPSAFKRETSNWLRIFLLVAFGIIAAIGNMIGRTATVGMALAGLYIGIVIIRQWKDASIRRLAQWVAMTFIAVFVLGSALYNLDSAWHNRIRFGFEGFFSLFEQGHWETTSTNMLSHGYVFPDNPKTWIIGDGYMAAPELDPYYQGESTYGFYKNTDVGYSRFIFYFGIIGLFAFSVFFITVAVVCARRFPEYGFMFGLLLLLNFLIWLKVSTDIFLIFAGFLSLQKESIEVLPYDQRDKSAPVVVNRDVLG